ncbi:NAD(P)/FAD-dependent oxidoreductase, partial [Nocardioides sp.]|uniref:NAD(P)/FAD-dependent oxidoreductase n=1 Tax=Nocardioides sp. TaxID=35761 RepID=UPI003569606F
MPRTETVFERQRPDASVVAAALVNVQSSCFWLDDAPRRVEFDALLGQRTADLVVVGGGYTGLWTAVRAKERDPGRRVVLLEAKRLGWAASGRNGGFCSASLTHGEANGISRWPEEYPELERLGEANLDAIGATVQEHAMAVDYERTGTIAVAVEPHQVAW